MQLGHCSAYLYAITSTLIKQLCLFWIALHLYEMISMVINVIQKFYKI